MALSNTIDQTGQCLCGKVKYKTKGHILFSMLCHYRACSRAQGVSPIHVLGVTKDNLEITEGLEHLSSTKGIGSMVHAFCSLCGCSIYQSPEEAPFRGLFPACFHYTSDPENPKNCKLPEAYKPVAHINYENRLYDHYDSLPKYLVWSTGNQVNNDGSPIDYPFG